MHCATDQEIHRPTQPMVIKLEQTRWGFPCADHLEGSVACMDANIREQTLLKGDKK